MRCSNMNLKSGITNHLIQTRAYDLKYAPSPMSDLCAWPASVDTIGISQMFMQFIKGKLQSAHSRPLVGSQFR